MPDAALQSQLNFQVPNGGGDVLVSILSMHAKRIFSGDKTFELRKTLPKDIPRRIFLYETERKAIVGHIIVERTLSGPPEVLWKTTGRSGTSRVRFFEYFAGRSLAHAFEISVAVRYSRPLPARSLRELSDRFSVPQSFLYLDRLPLLQARLEAAAYEESLAKFKKPFRLTVLHDENVDRFVLATHEHISGSYLETGAAYGKKLIEISSSFSDAEGIFTAGKSVIEIHLADKLIGFCVLTRKLGGCVKTGPTILSAGHRSEGRGQQFRSQLHRVLHASGYRKVFCTAPASNQAAVGYLLASGYRLEAHLRLQYHSAHDEFVFGFPLIDERGLSHQRQRAVTNAPDIRKLQKQDSRLALFLQDEFASAYCYLPSDWAARQIAHALCHSRRSGAAFKPRRLYVAEGNKAVQAAVLCTHKRGGAAKLLLVTATAHVESLAKLVSFVEQQTLREVGRKLRKFYTLVPASDAVVQTTFYAMGYGAEGILDRPYRSTDDILILAKAI